jgi:NADPH:quinone reductase-like Zn-dependent oxidoreductase
LVFVGNAGGNSPQADLSTAMEKNLLLRGVFMVTEFSSAAVRARLSTLLHEVRQGNLTVFIDRQFPLHEAAHAHAYAENSSVFGRVILSNEP